MAITFLAGNRAIGTNAERLAITTTNIQNGLEFHTVDTNRDYVWNLSTNAWILLGSIVGWNSPSWSDTFTSDNWTYASTGWSVTGGTMKATAVVQNASRRAYRSLGSSVSDTLWTCDIDAKPITFEVGDSAAQLMLNAGNDSEYNAGYSTNDQLGILFSRDAPSNNRFYTGRTLDQGPTTVTGGPVTFVDGTQYYVRFQRTSATNFRNSLFSNSNRSTHVTGSPKNITMNSTIMDLDNVVFSTNNFGTTGAATIEFDNLVITDNI